MDINYLLASLAEECGEVTQVCGKSLKFGLASHRPSTGELNVDRLREEFHDIFATYLMICEKTQEDNDLPMLFEDIDPELIERKRKRLVKYYSIWQNNQK